MTARARHDGTARRADTDQIISYRGLGGELPPDPRPQRPRKAAVRPPPAAPAPPAERKKALRVRLTSPEVEKVIGGVNGVAMRLLSRCLAEQREHGEAMRDAGGVYFKSTSWARRLGVSLKRIEHAFHALRSFGLMTSEWLDRTGRRGQTIRACVRTFIAGELVPPAAGSRVQQAIIRVPVSPEPIARAKEQLARRANRGGKRAGAGRKRINLRGHSPDCRGGVRRGQFSGHVRRLRRKTGIQVRGPITRVGTRVLGLDLLRRCALRASRIPRLGLISPTPTTSRDRRSSHDR